MQKSVKTNKKYLPWLIWGVGAGFYFVHYLARVFPSIMLPQLMAEFKVGAIALGNLAAVFYFAYVAMQVPAGMLIDRYGPRLLLVLACIVCAFSCLLYAFANAFHQIELARLLLGLATAFAFVCAIKLVKGWFSGNRLALMVGATQSLGMVGAAIGEAPMTHLMQRVGWHVAILIIGALFVLLVLLGIFVLRDLPANQQAQQSSKKKAALRESFRLVMSNRQTWINAIYVGMTYAPTVIFGEFWGASFLEKVHHLSESHAAFAVSLSFVAWAVGSVVIGYVSDALKMRRLPMIVSALAIFLVTIVILYLPLSRDAVYFFMLLFGFTSAGVSVSYALAGEINPNRVAGTSVAFANMASVLFGAIAQPIIGHILHWHWSGKLVNKLPFYSAGDYQWAMSVLTVLLIVGVISAFFIRETHGECVE